MAQRSATTRSQQWVGDRSFGAKRTSDERSKHSFLTFSKNRNTKKKRELPHLILFPLFFRRFPDRYKYSLVRLIHLVRDPFDFYPSFTIFFPSLSLLYRGRPAATSNLPVSNCVYESNRPYQVLSIYHTAAPAAAGLL